MKTYALLSVFALALGAYHVNADTIASKARILAEHPDQVFTLELPGKKLLATVKNKGTRRLPTDELSLWLERSHDYRLLKTVSAGVGTSFDQPRTFTSNGLSFIEAPTLPAGSGGFVYQHIFWIAPDDSISPVQFQPASERFEDQATPGELVLTGGEKDFFVEDDEMKFEFWLGRQGDPHCCPSGGTVSGTYKIVGNPKYDFFSRKYSNDLRIEIDTLHKTEHLQASIR